MVDALRLHEESLASDLVGFRCEDLTQAGEVIRVAVGDDEAVNLLRVVGAGVAEAPGQVAREHLVVAAVDKDDFSVRRFDDHAVALLDIDEVDLQDFVVQHGANQVGHLDAGRFGRLDVTGDGFGEDAAVGFFRERR